MKRETITINGMHCPHCVMAVKKELEKLAVNMLDVKIGEALVEYDERRVSHEQIRQAIEEAGYEAVN